ncbi:hypothetical protein V2J09_021655 [Rumex salicifolius]
MEKLSKQQKEWVRVMGCAIRLVDGSCIEVNEKEVERVLGIPREKEKISRGGKDDEHSAVLEEWRNFFKKMDVEPSDSSKSVDGSRPSHISTRLVKCKEELWFKRLIESNQKRTVNLSLVMNKVENLLYVDRTSIMEKKNPQTTPVFMGWTDQKLAEREKNELKFRGFGRGKIVMVGVDVTGETEGREQGMKRKNQTSVLKKLQRGEPKETAPQRRGGTRTIGSASRGEFIGSRKDEKKQKEKAKGKQKVDEQDQSLGSRHKALAQNLRSPFKQRYIDDMVLKDEFLEEKKNIEFALNQVHGRKLKDIDMIMVPVEVAKRYFVIALNIKNKNIHILDSAKEHRGKDYYKETVKKVVSAS